MANEKVFQSRIQLKHDIEENWSKATNFIPKVGEIIIYDIDENNSIARFKIGDGITNINSLPFVSHHEVISYLPQELTEEQQMQARMNQDLHWKEYVNKVLVSINTYQRKTDIPEDFINCSIANINIQCSNDKRDYQLEKQFVSHRESSGGTTFYDIDWFGNYNLILKDTDVFQDSFHGAQLNEETKYPDVPFVLYRYSSDMNSMNNAVYRLYLDETVYPNDYLRNAGVFLSVNDAETFDEIYHVIPEEYIPDTIARKKDVPEAQVQSNWNQSDENAIDYIKNRTHYSYEEEIIIFSGTNTQVVENGNFLSTPTDVIVYIYNRNGNLLESHECSKFYDVGKWSEQGILLYGNGNLAYNYDNGVSGDGNGVESHNIDLPFAVFKIYGTSNHNKLLCLVDESLLTNTDSYGIYNIEIKDKYNTQINYVTIPKEYLPAELNPDIVIRSTEQYLDSASQEQVRNNINANIKRLEIYIDKESVEGSIPTFNKSFNYIFSNINIDETTNTTGCVSPQYDIVLRNFYSDDGLINYSGTEMFVRYEQGNNSNNNQYNCLVFEGTCLKTAEKITIRYYENGEIVYSIEKIVDNGNENQILGFNSLGKNIAKDPEELIFNQIAMIDQITGHKYIVEIHNGTLVSFSCTNRIEVTSLPNITTYSEGDYFNPEGLVISAISEDGTTREITNYTYSKEYLTINDSTFEILYVENGVTHSATIELNIIKFDPSVELIDFEYIDNGDGTYTITGWKETLNGEPSTEMVIPDNPLIIL